MVEVLNFFAKRSVFTIYDEVLQSSEVLQSFVTVKREAATWRFPSSFGTARALQLFNNMTRCVFTVLSVSTIQLLLLDCEFNLSSLMTFFYLSKH